MRVPVNCIQITRSAVRPGVVCLSVSAPTEFLLLFHLRQSVGRWCCGYFQDASEYFVPDYQHDKGILQIINNPNISIKYLTNLFNFRLCQFSYHLEPYSGLFRLGHQKLKEDRDS